MNNMEIKMTGECNRYQMALSASLDGELDTEATRALFFHLAECERCRLFWNSSIRIERELLKEERIRASTALDARVASIGRLGRLGGFGKSLKQSLLRPLLDRAATSPSTLGEKVAQERVSFPYSFAAIVSILAVALGYILGTVQPWLENTMNEREPQVVYVSVLPDITVVGHLTE
ncbi:MAG: zf-HC2 domain-containing protein [Ignavibacteria bacterium]|nr:zf-HC2 domain-containing protein [Ignavibacteria bacterium]